ncbi:hypothetical protein FN846DRAFT_893727 [Sphaerosporella brunnea]|uniref:F-box domain-containing protein n=1 Tax=Sphaerosporella brunnea TaxID=1250544 RepID=A0A5J5ELD4_9PEZI|nr:hypothetical protein FN846DRAFT_893727 [Sphaerosporella brunnea]
MLPADLLLSIASSHVLAPPDLCCLNRVNKWFHAATLPLLYKDLTLSILSAHRAATVACLDALAANPARAALVHSLTLEALPAAGGDDDQGQDWSVDVEPELDRRLAGAIRRMVRLRRFHWVVPAGIPGEHTIAALWERRESLWCGLVGEYRDSQSWTIRRLVTG